MTQLICNELLDVIDQNKDNVIATCDAVLTLILGKAEGEQQKYFETFLKEIPVTSVDIDDFNLFFAQMREENITSKRMETDRLGDRIISNLIKKNVSKEEFYGDLWKRLTDDVLSGDEESKAVLLVRFWVDPRIPYYQLPKSCTMENDEYLSYLDSIGEQLKKAIFVIYAGLPQKTQKASLLMNIADEIEDQSARAVFWTVVLDQESVWQQRIIQNNAEEMTEERN